MEITLFVASVSRRIVMVQPLKMTSMRLKNPNEMKFEMTMLKMRSTRGEELKRDEVENDNVEQKIDEAEEPKLDVLNRTEETVRIIISKKQRD